MSVQPERQTTSLITAGSGTVKPPPLVVAALEIEGAVIPRKTANETKNKDFGRL
jgi:hypothetical protein